MFSSTCQGLELILVDSRFERGCLRCFRCLHSQSRHFPALMGARLGPWLEQQNSPLPRAPTQWQPPSQASSAAFRTGLSQLQPLGEGEAHLFSRGVVLLCK